MPNRKSEQELVGREGRPEAASDFLPQDEKDEALERTFTVDDRPLYFQTLADTALMRLGQSSSALIRRRASALGIRYYRRRLRRNSYDSNAFYFLGNLYLSLGRYGEAADAYGSVIHLVPAHVTSHVNLAWSCLRLYRYEEARVALGEALRLNPESVSNLYTYGYVCGSLKDYPEAVGACMRTLLLDPDHSGALFLAGYGSLKLGVYKDAARYFRKYIGQNPGHAPAHQYLGLACIKLGRFDEATEALTKAGKIEPLPEDPGLLLEHGQESGPVGETTRMKWAIPSLRPLGKLVAKERHT